MVIISALSVQYFSLNITLICTVFIYIYITIFNCYPINVLIIFNVVFAVAYDNDDDNYHNDDDDDNDDDEYDDDD